MTTPLSDILVYRIVRLRRLIAVTLIPSLLFVLFVVPLDGAALLGALIMVVFCLVAHVVRYARSWLETVNLAVTLCLTLLLYGLLNDHPAIHHVPGPIRLIAVTVFALVVFLMLGATYGTISQLGKRRSRMVSASRVSALDSEVLRQSLPPRPGQSRRTMDWGDLDTDGFFAFTPKSLVSSSEALPEDDAAISEPMGRTKFLRDEPGLVEVVSIMSDNVTTIANVYRFEPCEAGTYVTFQESSDTLSLIDWFGLWLQDFLTDYLVDELDTLENRSARSNRSQPFRMLVSDIGGLFPRGLEDPK